MIGWGPWLLRTRNPIRRDLAARFVHTNHPLRVERSFVIYVCRIHYNPTVLRRGEKVVMDLFHRKLHGKGQDTPTGRDCQFCYRIDPNFTKRDPMDRLVLSKLDDTAAAHLTEDGYVKHRIAELMKKRALVCIDAGLAKSA
jgi:hypothetical protein